MVEKRDRIDIEKIDLEKEKEKTTENPGIIEFPHTVGSALVRPEDKGKIKGRAVAAMRQQTDTQMKQIYEQVQVLVRQAHEVKNRVEVSERIYTAQMNFEPIIAHSYYLYEKEDDTDVLSMIPPDEWGRRFPFRSFVAKVTLLSDHTWDVEEAKGE